MYTGEALISGHPRDVKKVSITGAGRLRKCKNTQFVWELRKTAFCEGGHKLSFPLTRVSIRRAPSSVILIKQRAKKVVSDSPGLVDFAIGLVNSVINLPDGQVNFFEEFKLQKNCEINLLVKTFLGLVEMIFGLVNFSFSLPDGQL